MLLVRLSLRLRRLTQRRLSVLNTSVLVFGSNTDVGKTVVSAGLLRDKVIPRKGMYMKPIQTGETKDTEFIAQYCLEQEVELRTLYHWKLAASPHISARSSPTLPSDEDVVFKIQEEVETFVKQGQDQTTLVVIETAGGVLSPGPSGLPQASMYHQLRLPVVLVGDSRLGGISATLAAYEALFTRAYQIPLVVMIDSEDGRSDQYENADYLREYFSKLHSKSTSALAETPEVFRLSPLPDRTIPLHGWFHKNETTFTKINQRLDAFISSYNERLLHMLQEGTRNIWWPFTQHRNVSKNDVTLIESAQRDHFHTIKSFEMERRTAGHTYVNGLVTRNMFDACASWWTQVSHNIKSVK